MNKEELIKKIRKEESERIQRFKIYLEEQANWIMSEKDAELLLDVVQDFLDKENNE